MAPFERPISFTPPDPAPEPLSEARETNGITSRLTLAYAERAGGREAVEEVLRRAGLAGREAELRDENTWFSFATKIRLFEALAEVLDDPAATRRAGEHALELNVGNGLKVALRALGSPKMVYQSIVRANAKFSARHAMELLELGSDHARIRFVDLVDGDVHRLDCQYNVGLLSCVPALFGRPPALVTHPVCAVDGADGCIYEIRWDSGAVSPRSVVAGAATAGAALLAAALAAPVLLPAAGALTAAIAAATGTRAVRALRARMRQLETEAVDHATAADRLTASLEDLVSELRLGELLDKIVHNAEAAVSGKEFALLVFEDEGLTCRSSTGLPAASIERLERWLADRPPFTEPVLVEDVAIVPALADLPLRSLCAAPLVYRGETVGVLVALAGAPRTFLPRDVDVVRSYATQAAIALANARLFAVQHALATRDALTGLLNHREFHEALARELERCRRHGGEATVVLLDLDGFKRVNDESGHAEGDRVLRETAAVLAGGCRQIDLAFRLGGDEFALLLPETDLEGAAVVAARAAEAIGAVDERTTVSWGAACWPGDAGDKDVLLAQADARLYAMKGSRRRSLRVSDDVAELEAVAAQVAARLAELRRD